MKRCKRLSINVRYCDGDVRDYRALARHHYRDRSPATFCIVRTAWHVDCATRRRRRIGVAVLAWPVGSLSARMRHLSLRAMDFGERLAFANAHVRTIARVIVHPQFRTLGIGRQLVRDLVDRCPTRYIEASAVMGEFARVFAAAGLAQVPTRAGEPAYFIHDRSTESELHGKGD